MKATLLAKLELLAAAEETKHADAMRRFQASLEQVQAQYGVLDAYRTRLIASVQNGSEVSAAQIRTAGLFAEAGLNAMVQVAQNETRNAAALEGERAALAAANVRRRKLQDALAAALRRDVQDQDMRAERNLNITAPRLKED